MKSDQYPDCYIEANDGHFICYVIEYDEHELMDIDERWLGNIVEVVKTCRICGHRDIYYPM